MVLDSFDAWYSYVPDSNNAGRIKDRAIIKKKACSWTKKVINLYQSERMSYVIESRDKMLLDWYKVLEQVAPATVEYDRKGNIIIPEVLYYHFSKFSGWGTTYGLQ